MTLATNLSLPLSSTDEIVSRARQRWLRLTDHSPDQGLAEFLKTEQAKGETSQLLDGIFAGSPFLTDCLMAEPGILRSVVEDGAEHTIEQLLAETDALATDDRTRLMRRLREIRRKVALAVALADLSGAWSLEQVTTTLSRFADAAVERALAALVGEGIRRGELDLDPASPLAESGLIVLAMGKHGAFELNYSSDIDLILLFDAKIPYRGVEGPMACVVKLARGLQYILEHKTPAGYVFRTDLRLRPHLPGHPLAISTEDAELYYERHGQNWERAAFIKARQIAGDRSAGAAFLAVMERFVWRRHLDFAAIRDIHSIKRQINAHRGFATIRIEGHDIKVGRGGIREIEFFVQTQQLIVGGRDPMLRSCGTLPALHALSAARWVDQEAATELDACYRFLRATEHRLQMVSDRQTQTLPANEADFKRFSRFAGAAPETFSNLLRSCLETVERHYAALFEREPDLGAGHALVFTGMDDAADTLATLRNMGFRDPAAISGRIRAWHHGHIRATRSTRARELLTELLPTILNSLSRQHDIDAAFVLFDEFVSSLPAGIQLFSLFRAHPSLLQLVTDLIGAAPRLARHLARNNDLFEALLRPDFFDPLPPADALRAELRSLMRDAYELEEVLDLCRLWAHGRQFQASLQVFLGLSAFEEAALTLTTIAETIIAAMIPPAQRWLEAQHGSLPGGRFVVLGLGKLGSAELTTGSDLDLIFIYDHDDQARSDGPRSLTAREWYARLSQRLISALTARTGEGRLFDIDTRLRPSGTMGPVACSFVSFGRYHEETAETWEQQALTRARPIAGDPGLGEQIICVIDTVILRQRDLNALAQAVRAMRMRVFKQHGSDRPWAVKHVRGGLVELEFLAQYLQLGFAAKYPSLRRTATAAVFDAAATVGILTVEESAGLIESLRLQQTLQTVLRLSLADSFDAEQSPPAMKEALLRAAAGVSGRSIATSDFVGLERRLCNLQQTARSSFDRFCPPD
ncbi:bifunctional [glutamine synthetase] adenylyltransferase/[glutamine synthetase]-adenylyl-L-tyrosine phosphorylase [Arboricoccus pini]|nr:bifunctional [glutamine synthetase] adenylyltransferase/[glutamine synthetase]-adenylyl-L-tyrosine phosphorylase [Arboricoccus pini]